MPPRQRLLDGQQGHQGEHQLLCLDHPLASRLPNDPRRWQPLLTIETTKTANPSPSQDHSISAYPVGQCLGFSRRWGAHRHACSSLSDQTLSKSEHYASLGTPHLLGVAYVRPAFAYDSGLEFLPEWQGRRTLTAMQAGDDLRGLIGARSQRHRCASLCAPWTCCDAGPSPNDRRPLLGSDS